MSQPKQKDLDQIAEALNELYGDFQITEDHLYNVIILDNYVPDSPGWCGDIALVVHGVSCCKDILYRIKDKWTWVESMNEGEYNHNKELI